MRTFTPSPGFMRLRFPLVGLVAAAALSVPAIYWSERSSLAVWARKTERYTPKAPPREVVRVPGKPTPETIQASEATLADGDPILGVEAGGKARAYDQHSMTVKSRHVLNDVVGGKAVTVTFCDLNDCARAFGGEDGSSPLDVGLAGLDQGGMLLSVGEAVYFQETGKAADPIRGESAAPFPYASFPVTRTTWGEWKKLHPDTDVYVHVPPKADAPTPDASKPPVSPPAS
mgnify:CR=1 FL=1